MHGQVAQSKLCSLSKAPRSILDNLVAAHCEVLLCSGNRAQRSAAASPPGSRQGAASPRGAQRQQRQPTPGSEAAGECHKLKVVCTSILTLLCM